MKQRGLEGKYDHLSLAGGALRLHTARNPVIFFEHLDLAVKNHQIRRLIAIDHYDCLKLSKPCFSHMDEVEAHKLVFWKCSALVHKRYPDLSFEGVLMDLDGRHKMLVEQGGLN